jgi:tight adherence protein B
VGNILTYVLYAAVFIAVVLAAEGLWLTLRNLMGEGRDINRRLSMIRKTDNPVAALSLITSQQGGGISGLIDARFPSIKRSLWAARAPLTSAQMVGVALGAFVLVTVILAALRLPLPIAMLAGLLFGFVGAFVVVDFRAAGRRKRFLEQFPQSIDLIARSLQAGHPVPTALGVVAQQMPDPIGTEFGLMIDEMTYGVDRDVALQNLADRLPLVELRLFVSAVQVTRETGGNLAEVFLKLASVIREKAQMRAKVGAITAEGRLSCFVVSGLPIAVVLAIMVLNPSFYVDVSTDPLFWPMMSVPPVLLILGVWVIWRMVNMKI